MITKIFSKGISALFHPLLLVTYMLLLLLLINPYLFTFQDDKALGLLVISTIVMSLFFPLLSIGLMRMLGLVTSFEMSDSKERVGPLVVTGMFYIWLYVNIRSNPTVPQPFTFFVLGSTIALFIGFFLNNFTKISLHTIGMGGLLSGFFIMRYEFGYNTFILNLPNSLKYLINTDLILIGLILATGMVGTARLMQKAHNQDQIYGGYLIGIFSQLVAFLIVF